jgi:hypothetical protein
MVGEMGRNREAHLLGGQEVVRMPVIIDFLLSFHPSLQPMRWDG